MRRIFFFVLTNILVIATISISYTIICSVLGIQPGYYNEYGLDYTSLAVFSAVWGFGGAFISLLMSKWMAKRAMGLKVIPKDTSDPAARQLLETVHRLASAAKLPKMPEVAIYDSPEVNAFATGPSKSNSLVAVSTGLLRSMERNEVEGVLGHEIAHIANGDMVTLTLVQGVVNAFALFFSRILANIIGNAMRGEDERGPSPITWILSFVFDIVFTALGSIVVCYFSRMREFRADQGGATLAGRNNMLGALQALQRRSGAVDTSNQALAAFKINGRKGVGIAALFLTHPPLEDRIAALKSGSNYAPSGAR